MARLTRTQKFAGLREQMANDREAESTNEDLSKYEDKLKSLQSIFDQKEEEPLKEEIEEILIEEPVKEEPVEEEEKEEFDFLSSLDTNNIDKAVNDLINQKIAIIEEPVEEEEKEEDKPFDLGELDEIFKQIDGIKNENEVAEFEEKEEKKEEKDPLEEINSVIENIENVVGIIGNINKEVEQVIEKPVVEYRVPIKEEQVVNIIDEDYNSVALKLEKIVEDLNGKVEPVKEEEKVIENVVEYRVPIKEEQVVNIIDEDYNSVALKLEKIVEDLNGKVEPVKEEEKVIENVVEYRVPIKEEQVVNIIDEDYNSVALKLEKIVEDLNGKVDPVEEKKLEEVNNGYVDETLAEVEEYNKNDGQKTVEEISKTLIENIRHNKEEKEAIKAEDDFSNTVSLEIDKVLNELSINNSTVNLENVLDNEIVAPVEIKPEEFAEKLADTIEHPVLAKAKDEEPIEIMPMEETFKQEVLDDTIPFVMDDVKEEDEEEVEYYDDEKPNKILNIFLIILIVILLAILGVIAYYILYAKGIIG